MIKKFTAAFAIIAIIFTLTACKEEDKEPTHKTGWNNPDEPTVQQTTAPPVTDEGSDEDEDYEEGEEPDDEEEEEDGYEEAEPEIPSEAVTEPVTEAVTEISFSEESALLIGSFRSEVYGTLTVYLQNDHFLILDEYKDQKFTIYAEGYSPAKTDNTVYPMFNDMNFDGYTDFGVCYYKDTLNAYFFCFLWNTEAREFVYTHSLTNLANPEFDPVTKEITALQRITATTATEKTFSFAADGSLSHLTTNEIAEEPATDGAEIIDAKLQITESGDNVAFTMAVNPSSHSKWQCLIDDETIVTAAAEGLTADSSAYEFILTSLTPGATTVIFRYASTITGDYIEEIIVNVIVKEDLVITVVVPE